MLELIDLDRKISKEDYDTQFSLVERELGECQRLARAAGVPVLVVFEGWDSSGKGTVINRLTQALDPRGFKVYPIMPPNEIERFHPWMWRFWNKSPAAGDWAIFDRSWYRRVLEDPLEGTVAKHEVLQAMEDIRQFEQQLADSGAVIVKFWLHISKREQKKRFKQLLDSRVTAWKIGKAERREHRHYDQRLPVVEEMIARTNSAAAPWTIVEATQRRFARLTVFRTLVATIREAISSARPPAASGSTAEGQGVRADGASSPLPPGEGQGVRADGASSPLTPGEGQGVRAGTVLDRADLSLSLDRAAYEAQRDEFNERLLKAEHELYLARIPAVICYEGWDAGGKGGNIKRLTQGLDPRGYEVVPIAAPTKEEKAHHYLWRFWRCIPKAGHITIFDRTWYGRVLVERVEGFCSAADWKRAYDEINQFERQLVDFGAVLVKFWLQIDGAEQLRRFQERQKTPYKQWKITDEDWRNREKRPTYEPAVDEMLRRTSTPHAPWTILEANCKYYARIKALRTVAAALENAVGR
jgi:polyphosphate kinase 2 (PPK2 family)